MIKGVCVGLGYFGQFHLEAWNRLENVEIGAVCDIDKKKAGAVAKTYGIEKSYTDLETMLFKERPGFIDIITPPETHLEIILLAIKYKMHIICQKPVAPTLDEAKQIANAIKNSKARMMVHENFRFQPWHSEIKKLLTNNTLGKLHTINIRMRMGDGWQKDAYMNRQPYFREMKKLLMYETGIHFIDLFGYYAGNITKVYARLKRLNNNIKGEDFGWVQFDFDNGCLGFFDANRYNESTCENPRLTFGTVLIEGSKGSIRLYEDGAITIKLLGEEEKNHPYHFKNQNFSGDCVYFTQQYFLKQLENEAPFDTGISSYLKNIIVLDKIYESAEKGQPVKIDKSELE